MIPERLEEFEVYYIYELSKHTTVDVLCYRFNTTKEKIAEIITRYLELEASVRASLNSKPNKEELR